MKRIFLTLSIIYCVGLFAQKQIVDLSTGVANGTNTLIALGTNDDTWMVFTPDGKNLTPKCISFGSSIWPIWQNSNCSRWITPYTNGTVPVRCLEGNYIYSMSFTTTSLTACSAVINISFIGGDNKVTSLSVNGTNHSFSPQPTFNPLLSNVIFSLNPNEIKFGLNNISVTVYNIPAQGDPGSNDHSSEQGLNICGNLTIDYNPLTPLITGGNIFCSGTPLVFTGNSGLGVTTNSFWEIAQCDINGNVISGGYVWNTWTGVPPGVFTFPNSLNPPCGKYYKIKLAVANYCQPWVEANKIIYIACNPALTVTGPQAVCASSGAVLTATGASTYFWTPTNQTGNQVLVHPGLDCNPTCGRGDGKTVYTVRGTNTYGCTSTAGIAILPVPQNLSIDISTGVNTTVNPTALIPFGSPDPDWKIRGIANTSPYTAPFSGLTSATVIQPYGGSGTSWVNNPPNESWITSKAIGNSADPNATATINTDQTGYYWYENRFTLPNAGYTSQLNVSEISADNDAKLYLNSPNALTNPNAYPDITAWSAYHTAFKNFYGPFTITNQSKFISGENVIQVAVYNLPSSSYTPTGLILRGSVSASCPIVEPCLSPVISVSGGSKICPGVPSVTLAITQYSSGTIQWEKKECSGSFTTITGATSSSYIVASGNSNGTSYRVKIICNGVAIYSNIIDVYQLSDCNAITSACSGGGGVGGALKIIDHATGEKAKVSHVTGEEAEASVNLYPNPFNKNFTAVYDGKGEIKIEVMDVLGKILISQRGNGKEKINLKMNDSPSGVYLVKIIAEGNIITKKVIKQ